MKKIASLLCAGVLTLTMAGSLTGCGGGSVTVEVDRSETQELREYTLFANDLGAFDKDNSIVEKWEKQFNIKLKLEGGGADWMETLCLRANSDDMPDLFFFVPNDTNYMSAYTNLVKKGMILPMSQLSSQAETPNLDAVLNVEDFKDLRIDGDMYFAPQVSTSFNNTIYVRRDWMNKLGIKDPATLEEFEAMLKAFKERDPDGNGKNDTYGMAASKTFDWLSYFKIAFGVTPGWSKVDGAWQLDAFTQPYRSYLECLNGWYKKGYMKNEFFLYDDSDALNDFYNGLCGVVMYNGGRATGGVTYKMKTLNKDAEVDVLPMPDGTAQGGYATNGDWWGGWSISYSAKEPMRLARFLDYLYSEEGTEERLYGIKGVHYDKDDAGNIVLNFENRMKEKDFFGATEDGKPRDMFAIGSYFGAAFKVESGKLIDNTSDCIYSESELAHKSIAYANRNLKRIFPMETLNLGTDYADGYSRVADRVYTYSVRIISGSMGLDEGLAKMKELALQDGYEQLQKTLEKQYG